MPRWAGTWLDTLSAAARGGCVVALPFADADLVALARGKLTDLTGPAVADGRAVVAEILGTPVLDATTWPSGGVLDEAALAGVAAAGTRTVVLDADAVDGGEAGETGGAVPVIVGPTSMVAVLTDTLLTRAADAPDTPASMGGGTATTVSAAATSPPLATQDAAATLVFRALARQGQPVSGGPPIVLAPPHVWNTDETGARALLATVDLLLDSGRLRVRGLADIVSTGPTTPGPARQAADPLQAGSRDIPPTVLESVREMRADVLDLRSAAVPETGVGASVDATFTPLLQGVLRPASATWHGRPDLATAAATAAAARIEELRESVRVLPPPSPYSLGTTDAPLLLTVANGLPVTMEVRLSISSTTGLRVAPIPPQRIPPLGRRQVQVSAEVVRSGQFSVEATVHSPAGRALGPPSRLQVRSTAYGTITVWLTGSAAVLLVVLAAYRVVRRIRGEPSPRDRTGPSVGPPATLGPPVPEPRPRTPGPPNGTLHRRSRRLPRRPCRSRRRHRSARRATRSPRRVPYRPAARDPPGPVPPRSSLGRASSLMAVASLVSRITGYLRQLALVAVLGLGVVNDSYTVANTLPNIVYELLLGGVLTSVMVPLLVRAQTEDARRRRGVHPAAAHRWRVPRSPSRPSWRWLAAPLLTRLYLGGSGRRMPSSRRPSPGCCCRRSSSTAWARCSVRSSTRAAVFGPPPGLRCSTTSSCSACWRPSSPCPARSAWSPSG